MRSADRNGQIWQDFSRNAAAIVVALGWIAISTLAVRADGPGPLEGRFFGNANGSVLVVTLHGDLSNGSSAQYQYDIAQRIAQGNQNVVAFGIIRPGYSDGAGLRSPGSNNNRRDHYTSRNNALVATTIQNLKRQTGATRVVAVGHSGGAAQLGAVIGAYPGLVDSAILASCPCDIRRWRQMRGKSVWRNSQSPLRFAGSVGSSTRVFAITGSSDSNTSPTLAQSYVANLKSNGVPSAFVSVSGAGHSYRGLRAKVEQIAIQETRQ